MAHRGGGDPYPPRAPSRYLADKHYQHQQERQQRQRQQQASPQPGSVETPYTTADSQSVDGAPGMRSSSGSLRSRIRTSADEHDNHPTTAAATTTQQQQPPQPSIYQPSRPASAGHTAGGSMSGGLPPGAPSGSRINTVTYKNATIKALIDPSLRVSDVIRQLCANAHLGVQEPPALFALRDEEDDDLIDDDNMARKIEAGRNFKLCSSPTIEAVEIVDKLNSRDERGLKMALYSLQRLIRERAFTEEFIKRGGFEELIDIIRSLDGGNTLAYALTCVQNLIESSDEGWDTLDAAFIRKVVNILATQERINVCRPATAILKKLVVAGPNDAPASQQGNIVGDEEEGGAKDKKGQGSAMERATDQEARKTRGEIPRTYRYGFDVVYDEIHKEPTFLQTLTQRLSSADTTLCIYSLSLINSLMRSVSDKLFDAFTSELEQQGVSKAVVRLMDSNRGDELSSSILEYQMNVIRVAHHRMHTTVTPTDKRHVSALSYLWLQARIAEASREDEDGQVIKFKWRRLGFENENVAKDFARVGWLGLECCENFVRTDPEQYTKIIQEQINRPEGRRCPWGQASLEVVEILADHYDISSGYSTATHFQPRLLGFSRLHYLALRFFLRMWTESGASKGDFGRVSALVRTQVKEALRDESARSLLEIESDFLESDYRDVRDRQMRELEVEDDYTNKGSIRNLRGRLYRESYEFVRQQRIQCLLEGAWFRNPTTAIAGHAGYPSSASTIRHTKGSLTAGPNGLTNATKPWRFYRLSPNKKFLYYCETHEKCSIRSGLDDLPERIDLSLVTDISVNSAAGQAANGESGAGLNNDAGLNGNGSSSGLTFSLLRAPDLSVADFVALNASQFSEWTDGLNMLRSETGSVVSTKETADFIQILTDIGVKVKLLDLTGEQVEVTSAVAPAPVPQSTSFFFAEL